MNFKEEKEKFDNKIKQEDGYKTMQKATNVVNEIGQHFLEMNGGELTEAHFKLAGYKFYLAEFMADVNRIYEALKLEIKHIRASEWDRITEEIKAKEGKVKNKEQIENVLTLLVEKEQIEQMLYETLYYKYKLKISSIDSILMAIVQRTSELRRQIEQQ